MLWLGESRCVVLTCVVLNSIRCNKVECSKSFSKEKLSSQCTFAKRVQKTH